jgi:anti-sigma regulatory factor (Ser/Thr protein kinase)
MIAVTTHSRTRGLRYTLPMLLAGRLIERELRDAPGCERYANVIAGPREFWTLTIWRDGTEMRKCMRERTHGRVMWQQPHWLECYWGMRWRPGPHQSGEWEGKTWPWPVPVDSLEPAPPQRAEAVGAMPRWMQAVLGHAIPVEQRQIAGAAGASYRLRVPPRELPSALRDVRRLRRIAAADRDSFAVSLGLGSGRALYLLIIATSREALERLRATPEHRQFLQRWGDRAWWSTWEPEAEFGHWERRRLRDGQFAGAPLVIDASLPAEPIAAREARRTLRARLPELDPASFEVLQLLTSELVANSARHARLAPTDRIGLQVRAEHDMIRVEVIDRGRQFEPQIPAYKSPAEKSGWGLYMVNRTTERWGITRHGLNRHIWFELRVPVPPRARAARAPETVAGA